VNPTRTRAGLALSAAVVAVVLFTPAAADAHAVGAEPKLVDGRLQVDAFYDDDSPAEDAKISVTDAAGNVVAEGKTDDKGRWSCPAPPPGKYGIKVDAGAGHRAVVKFTVPDPAAPAAGGPPVSDGPTRAEFTGPVRYVWAAVGLLAIGGGTWVAMRVLRGRSATAGDGR
jgi:nickel transport protein